MPAEVRQEVFGKFTIRSGRVAEVWQARAFRGTELATEACVGSTREEAIDRVKQSLRVRSKRVKEHRGGDGAPSAAEYAEAFERLGQLAPGYEAMLEAHLNAYDHLITAAELARAAGYRNWSAANLHYGTLGKRLAIELDYDPPKREDGSPIWTYTLATAAGEGDLETEQLYAALERGLDDPHFEWLMRPQVREALKRR